jgi:hypothetical protein
MPHRKTSPRTKAHARHPSRRRVAKCVETQVKALAKVPSPAPLAVLQSAIPTIRQTVESFEQVRRFVSKCLNPDLQRELAKLAKRDYLVPAARVDQEKAIRRRFEIDWGTIPGVDKPFLMQPGAEKILFWLLLKPTYHNEEIDLCAGHLEMVSWVSLDSKKTKETVFDGPKCSCTTMEDNYRFRTMERDPLKTPNPTREEAERLKAAGLGRWRQKDQWVSGRKVGVEWIWLDRIENPNIWNERNKVRQIGQKRALVKAVRNCGALSEIFTSDPGEWDLPPESEDRVGNPYLDAQFTEGGRRMETVEPKKPPLTAEQQSVADVKTQKAQEVIDRMKQSGAARPVKPIASSIVYELLGDASNDQYVIDGPAVLMDGQRDILRRFWKPREAKIIVNGEELEGLKYTFAQRGVSFVLEVKR